MDGEKQRTGESAISLKLTKFIARDINADPMNIEI